MNIQWYPGHMVKTKRLITENIKLVDVIVEILDARIPISSRNPQINELTGDKPRVIILNKSDISDAKVNREWEQYFKSQGIKTIMVDSIKGTGLKDVITAAKEFAKPRLEYEKSRGRLPRAIRIMVVGIPNVGKSSFINKIVGKGTAKTGDKPGVTRGKQWIRISSDVELLDMPGILWPKFEEETGFMLAFTGAINDDILDIIELAAKLLECLKVFYPENLKQRYKLEGLDYDNGLELLKAIGKKRGAIAKGGEIDLTKSSQIVLDEFRGAKIGNISLERANDLKE